MQNRRAVLSGLASTLGLSKATHVSAQNASIRVAAASDLKFALSELGAQFEKATGLKLSLNFGSSGNLARQLEQGLPMDLFLSADEDLVLRLAKSDWARDAGVVYGTGRLAWIMLKKSSLTVSTDLNGLSAALATSGKLSIANPDHAPYGRAARSALQSAGLWQAVQNRLVLGENVSQATQFVSTGAASVGIVALSLALAPEVAALTKYGLIDASLHPPIIQRMALSRTAGTSAQKFYAFLQTDAAKKVLSFHGLG